MASANIILELVDRASAGLKNATTNVRNFGRSVENQNRSVSGLTRNIVAVGTAITGAFATKAIIDTTARFEDLRDSLQAVTGDGQAAFDQILSFATQTQFGVEELTESFIKLSASGVNPLAFGLKDTNELLTVFTDTAAITTDQIGSLQAITDLFARTTAGGLGLEDLNRLADRGVPVFTILEEKLGLARLEISKFGQTTEGANIILRTLIKALNEDFGGATASRMDNLSTQISNFKIQAGLAADAFGRGFKDALGEATAALTDLIANNEQLLEDLGRLVGDGITFVINNLDLLKTALELAGIAFGVIIGAKIINGLVAVGQSIAVIANVMKTTLIPAIAAVATALKALALSNPFTAIALAATTAAALIITNWDKVKAFFAKFFEGILLGWEGAKVAVYSFLNLFGDFDKELEDAKQGFDDLLMSLMGFNDESEVTVDSQEKVLGAMSDVAKMADKQTESVHITEQSYEDLRKELQNLDNVYKEYQRSLESEVELAGMSNIERQESIEIQKALKKQAEALGKTVDDLTDKEKQNVKDYVKGQLQKKRENEKYQDALVKLEQESSRIVEQVYNEQFTELERLEQEYFEYKARARELDYEDTVQFASASLAFETAILEEKQRLEQEAYEETLKRHQGTLDSAKDALESQRTAYQSYTEKVLALEAAKNDGIEIDEAERIAYLREANQEYIDAMTTEYDDLYGFFSEKITDMTGLTNKEFGIMEEIVQLTFGVNVTDVIKGTFAAGIQSILGFRNQGTADIGGLKNDATPLFNGIANTIDGTFLQKGLSIVGDFALGALGQLGGLADGIFSLFGGVGDFLGSTFGGAFKSISGAIGNLFGGGGGGSGGIFSTIGSFFGPVGGVIGGIADFFFNDGGYIAPGGVGIVGETGPELVSGPAYITGRDETDSMLRNMNANNVNVSFTVNAVDARSFESLLVERREVIVDVIRQAVEERPTRTIRGIA